jgi:hypothetical protein
MKYDIKAIPTTYAGVNFRSRLEARWAAFFDLCGWKWDYEPFDLEGWAPDFMLKGKIKALVEVKPIDFRGDDEKQLYRQAKTKAGKAFGVMPQGKAGGYSEYEVIVVGNGPFETGWWAKWSLGVFAAPDFEPDELERELYGDQLKDSTFGSDVADLFYGHDDGPYLDYAARYGCYQYRVGGQYDGDHHLRHIRDDEPERLWREAGNVVQWQADNSNYRGRRSA